MFIEAVSRSAWPMLVIFIPIDAVSPGIIKSFSASIETVSHSCILGAFTRNEYGMLKVYSLLEMAMLLRAGKRCSR